MSSSIKFEADGIRYQNTKWDFTSLDQEAPSLKLANLILQSTKLLDGDRQGMLQTVEKLSQHPHPRSIQAACKVRTNLKYTEWLNNLPVDSHKAVAEEYLNRGDYLRLAFDGVVGQTVFPWEIIEEQRTLTLRGIYCGIATCDNSFATLTRLTSLEKLYFHRFFHGDGTIPPSIQANLIQLSTLREVLFIEFPLTEVPECLARMPGLITLGLEHNGLRNLGGHFHPNLQELSIRNWIEKFSGPIHVSTLRIGVDQMHAEGIEFIDAKKLILEGSLSSQPDLKGITSLQELSIESTKPGNLSFLQGLDTLHNLSVCVCFLSEVIVLTQLRVLELKCDFNTRGPICIDSLTCLQSLESFTTNYAVTSIPNFNPEYFHAICLRSNVSGSANSLIARCTKVNLLTRMILRNMLPEQPDLFKEWLRQPYTGPSVIPDAPISFCAQTHFPYPTPLEFLELDVQKSLLEDFNSKNLKIVDYTLELANEVGHSFRFNVTVDVPPLLYNRFFITFFLSYADSVEAGEQFEKQALKVLLEFFMNYHEPFKLDSIKYGADFTDGFLNGKCCYSLERYAFTQIDFKSAWLPRRKDGSNPVHPSKVNRSVKLHKQGIF